MNIERLIVGPLETNTYIVTKNNKTVIIDPGFEEEKIIKACDNKNVVGILITHHHFDHIGALRNFLTKRSIKIFKRSNVEENKIYNIGDFSFKCLYTPGHSKDSVTFYFEDEECMFIGDFIFKDSIGRTDLPGGDQKEMQQSIDKLLTIDKDVKLYPGHYEETTLNEERKNNEYLKK